MLHAARAAYQGVVRFVACCTGSSLGGCSVCCMLHGQIIRGLFGLLHAARADH